MSPDALHGCRIGLQVEVLQPAENTIGINQIRLGGGSSGWRWRGQEPGGLVYCREAAQRGWRGLDVEAGLGARALLVLVPGRLDLVLEARADLYAVTRAHHLAVLTNVVEKQLRDGGHGWCYLDAQGEPGKFNNLKKLKFV